MSTAFSRTLRSLRADGFRWSATGLPAALVFAVAWGSWATLTKVTLYEITETARLEVASAVYPIQSPVVGRVVSANMQLGREVREGEVLVEVDSAAQQLQLGEERTRLGALEREL